jgi:SEC-C motif
MSDSKGRIRNQPCPCGSGQKFKRCHGAVQYLSHNQVRLPGGAVATINSVQATLDMVTVFPLPIELLKLARWATGQALRPGADYRPTIMCVMFVAGAGEGIVNTLLEPLVPPEEWQDPAKRDGGLNWARPYKKWVKLSEKIGMRPNLDILKDPLKGFIDVIDVRNELLHFNLGRNVVRSGVPVPTSYNRGHVQIGPPDPAAIAALQTQLSERLSADRALGYFHALADLLRVVLPAHEGDPFGFTAQLSQLIEQDPEPAGE